DRGAEEVIALAHRPIKVWSTVTCREVDQPEFRIDGRCIPDRRPAAHRVVSAGRPGVAAELAGPWQRIGPPQNGAGLGIQSGEAPAYPKIPTRDAAVNDAVVVKRRTGDGVAIFIVLDRDLPHHRTRLHV